MEGAGISLRSEQNLSHFHQPSMQTHATQPNNSFPSASLDYPLSQKDKNSRIPRSNKKRISEFRINTNMAMKHRN